MRKKIISLLLCVLLILSLSACGKLKRDPQMMQQEAELEHANALMEAGDYEAAIGILESMDTYRQITQKLDEAEIGYQKQQLAEFDWLFGTTWYALERDMQVTFQKEEHQPGEWVMHYQCTKAALEGFSYYQGKIPFTMQHGQCILQYFSDFETVFLPNTHVVQRRQNGITILNLGGIEFAAEKQVQAVAGEKIEITMENWQDFFEIKTADEWIQDDFGDISDLKLVTYIALKEEYLDRVDLKNSDVTIGYSYGWDLKNCKLDLSEPSYQLTSTLSSYGTQSDTFTLPEKLGDYQGRYPDYLGGSVSWGYDFVMNVIGVTTNYQITKIAGTLTIR